jgi:DNA-binding transcriptional LysR family regulator
VDINALDLNLIRVFDALWHERSATRAGDRIGLSQPAVSAALTRLRAALGDQLFVRRGNDMVPTPRAEELAPRARLALDQIERMLAPGPVFDPAGLQRTFTILTSDFFSMLMLPPLAEAVRSAAPGVRLRILDSAFGDVSRVLREGSADMALERPVADADGMRSQTLFQAPFVLVAARGDPAVAHLAEGDLMPIELFCALDHALRAIDGAMQGYVDAALAEQGQARRVTLSVPHFQAAALAVSRGGLIAALPVQFARVVREPLGLVCFRSPVPIPVPEISIYWHPRHDKDSAHRWLRRTIVEMNAALGFDDVTLDAGAPASGGLRQPGASPSVGAPAPGESGRRPVPKEKPPR